MAELIEVAGYKPVTDDDWSLMGEGERQWVVQSMLAVGRVPRTPVDGVVSPIFVVDRSGAVNGGQAAVSAVTDDGGSDTGSPAGDSVTGLGLHWPDWGVLSQTKEFPWLLLGAGLILMVMASRRHGRR